MILFLNTSGFDQIHFGLVSEKKVKEQIVKVKYPETEKTLGYLEKFLKSNRANLSQLDKIVVVTGSGSFTGIRLGVSMSLAFSFAKDIPVFSLKAEDVPKDLRLLETMKFKKITSNFNADYGAEPNITIKN